MSLPTRLVRIGLRNSFAISRRYKGDDDDPCEPSPRWKKLKKIQEMYAQESKCPIHLRGGTKDQILYRITWGLTLLGLGMSLFQLSKFVLP